MSALRSLLTAIVLLANPAIAGEDIPKFSANDMVPLANGLNWVDLDGDGVPDLVMKAWLGNVSVHVSSIYTFYMHILDPEKRTEENCNENEDACSTLLNWNVVRVVGSHPKYGDQMSFHMEMGADCILHDIRLVLVRGKGRNAR